MNNRSIHQIIPARQFNMGDLKVRQPLPSLHLDYLDPFILLHHVHTVFDDDIPLRLSGVGPHPHRGFSPVTFVFKGGTHHRDSRGNDEKVSEGGTQWMHAGMGIVHSERPLEHEMEIVQLWINSPAKNKKDQPFYYPLKKEDTPTFTNEDKTVIVNIITGNLLNIRGPIPTLSPVNAFTVFAKQNGKITIPLPSTHHAFLYLLDGVVSINEQETTGKNFIQLNNDGDSISIEFMEATRCLLMSGEPIGEKIVAQGPFVMNSETEILEAYRDYQIGKMGILIE